MAYWLALAITGLVFVAFGFVAFFLRRGRTGSFTGFILRYLAVFLSLLGLETFVLWLFPSFHLALQEATAAIVAEVLRLAGEGTSVSSSVISVQNTPVVSDITVACLGGLLLWVYLGLVWAETRLSRRQRLVGSAVGLVLIAVFNLFRIYLSIKMELATGTAIHDYFYVINMLFVLLVWAVWLRVAGARKSRSTGASAGGRRRKTHSEAQPERFRSP